jgi:hypothetical protein
MKIKLFKTSILALATFAAVLRAGAQSSASFNLTWNSVSGGGGNSASTGGVLSLSGTVGQADAGDSMGANYLLLGGFWAAEATGVVTSQPILRITRAGPNLIILSWPSWASDYTLQSAEAITSNTIWANVSQTPVSIDDQYAVPIITTSAKQFFRLKRL